MADQTHSGRISEYHEMRRGVRAVLLAEVLARHNKEEPHTDIARDLGVCREYVRQLVREAGGKPRRKKWNPPKIAILKKAAGDVLMGSTFHEAAKKHDLSLTYLRMYCAKVGVRSKHKIGRPRKEVAA